MFYVIFDWATLYLLWRYRRKRARGLLEIGIVLFVMGQSLGFLNPELQIFSLSINISAISALLDQLCDSGAGDHQPAGGAQSQVEAIRKVNVAITSQAGIDLLLNQIAMLAATLLSADGVGIFLNTKGRLQLAYAHELPNNPLRVQPALPRWIGRHGDAARCSRSTWTITPASGAASDDLPFARETFGSVICTPLIHGGEAIGALMVVAAQRHGRLFWREDVYYARTAGRAGGGGNRPQPFVQRAGGTDAAGRDRAQPA